MKKLLAKNDIEDALKRLDTLTVEEARMATAETLKVANRLTEIQSRENLQKWLSPPDPSINHNIARKAHHEGTASWFLQGGTFQEWKSSPLIWIHGKRTFLFLSLLHPADSHLSSGIGQKCPVVRYLLLFLPPSIQSITQLRHNRRHQRTVRSRIGNRGLFLLRLPR